MNIRSFMGHVDLPYIGLLALVVWVIEGPVLAQELKGLQSLEQVFREAAFDGQSEKVRSILDKGAKPDARDPDDRTALMMASLNGHKETVRLLLDRGAIIDTRDAMGRTALMVIEAKELSYVCGICGQHTHYLPTGGLIYTDSMTFPIKLCPDCGPCQWEIMQICREITLGAFQN